MAFTYCTNCGERIDGDVERCPHCNYPTGKDRVYGYAQEEFGRKTEKGDKGSFEDNKGSFEDNKSTFGENKNSFGDNKSDGGQRPWQTPNSQGGYGQGGYGQSGDGQIPWQTPGQNDGPYGQNPYGQNPYNQGPYNQGPYGQGPYNQGPYNQGPYNQGPYNQGPFGYGQNPWGAPQKRKASVGLIVFSILNILFGYGIIFGGLGLFFAITARDSISEAEELRRKKLSLAINIIGVVISVVVYTSIIAEIIASGGDISSYLSQIGY
jgi:hypothetical protein